MDAKKTALTFGGIGIILAALGYSIYSPDQKIVEIPEGYSISATEFEFIGNKTRELYVIKSEYDSIDSLRLAAATTYEAQLRAKQGEIESKESEIIESKSLPATPQNDQNLGKLTRDLYVLKFEYQEIDAIRAAGFSTYEAQLRLKQEEVDSKIMQIISAQDSN